MGVYDRIKINSKDEIQIKCTNNPSMHIYQKGDKIPELENGLYIGYEGWFVIEDTVIIAIGTDTFDKWGKRLDLRGIIQPYSGYHDVDEFYKSDEKLIEEGIDEIREKMWNLILGYIKGNNDAEKTLVKIYALLFTEEPTLEDIEWAKKEIIKLEEDGE